MGIEFANGQWPGLVAKKQDQVWPDSHVLSFSKHHRTDTRVDTCISGMIDIGRLMPKIPHRLDEFPSTNVESGDNTTLKPVIGQWT